MKYVITGFLFFFCLTGNPEAQNVWRKSKHSAESAEREGKFAEAAALYEAAWKGNNKKTKLVYQAAELYAQVRDYQRAADCYKVVKDDKEFPFARLYYARALRQCGAYEKAISEYALFTSNYGGNGADKLRDFVQKEIRGCEMGLQGSRSTAANAAQVLRIGSAVNSTETEFAPIPFGEDLLYFSSNVSGKPAIYRSQKQSGNWSKAVQPAGFPDFKNSNFCNGSFSPDNTRFYFTECVADKGLQATCQIYVMNRKGDRWSEPLKLPASVNASGYTSTHPHVAIMNGKEYLFFTSNKPGGKGGMDIYCARIYPEKKDPTFGIALNLGDQINTEGNEVTPFFDTAENALYFSSNAHISMGGLDIQRAKQLDKADGFGKAENAGIPYNSPADDYYFVKQKANNGGFLVSNRATKDKMSTTDDDILEFATLQKNLVAKGRVSDKCTGMLLADCRVNLFEITTSGQKRLLNTKMSKDGNFSFPLLSDKKFRLEAEKKGYRSGFFEITAHKDSSALNQEKNIELDCDLKLKDSKPAVEPAKTEVKSTAPAATTQAVSKPAPATAETPVKSEVTAEKVAVSLKDAAPAENLQKKMVSSQSAPEKSAQPVVAIDEKKVVKVAPTQATMNTSAKEVSKDSKAEKSPVLNAQMRGMTSVGTMPLYETRSRLNEYLITSAPKHAGTYYKIQIIALKRFDFEEKRYDSIRGLGRADTEYIVKKDMVRVLLADYFTLEEAQKLLPEIRKNREFSSAFVVQYVDGVRY